MTTHAFETKLLRLASRRYARGELTRDRLDDVIDHALDHGMSEADAATLVVDTVAETDADVESVDVVDTIVAEMPCDEDDDEDDSWTPTTETDRRLASLGRRDDRPREQGPW